LKIVQRWWGGVHMNRWRVGEDRGSKEKDRCPLTICWLWHFGLTANVLGIKVWVIPLQDGCHLHDQHVGCVPKNEGWRRWYAIGTTSTCRPKQADGFQCILAKLGKRMMTSCVQKDDDFLHTKDDDFPCTKDNDSPHMQSQWHLALHSYVSNCYNAW
jgi:hypothetical protein